MIAKERQTDMATSKGRSSCYEGMWIVAQNRMAELGDAIAFIRHTLERHGAEVLALRKWDERRFAYEMGKSKRGFYILTYFRCDPVAITAIDREANLSELVLRQMILKADHLTEDEMRASDAAGELEVEAKMRRERELERAASANEVSISGGDSDESVEEEEEAEASA